MTEFSASIERKEERVAHLIEDDLVRGRVESGEA